MTEDTVRAAVQPSTTERSGDINMRRNKGPRRMVRRRRSTRENEYIDYNQNKLASDERVFYRSTQEKTPVPAHQHMQFQLQLPHHLQYQQPQPQPQLQPVPQQQQQHQQQQYIQLQQVKPASPVITPPLSTSHPLSSYETQPQDIRTQIPFPMAVPMPMPTMPMAYGGPQVPIQFPMGMPAPFPMANFPLPMFIRLPIPIDMNYFNENLKVDNEVNGSSGIPNPMANIGPMFIPNFIPLMFPPHLGPMFMGPPQPMMYPQSDSISSIQLSPQSTK